MTELKNLNEINVCLNWTALTLVICKRNIMNRIYIDKVINEKYFPRIQDVMSLFDSVEHICANW
jgi:hypothetical protein